MVSNASCVVLNDTRPDAHHGCARVMRNLVEGLTAAGIRVRATCGVNRDWRRNPKLLAEMCEADLILVNGEGTLHHGSKRGEALLAVVEDPRLAGQRKVLVNALYQDNPADWAAPLRGFDLVYARDSRSAAAMAALRGAPVRWLPDLSLADAPPAPDDARRGLVVGDSVSRADSLTLLALARHGRAISTRTHLKQLKGEWPGARLFWTLRNAAAETLLKLRRPRPIFLRHEAQYRAGLGAAALHLTGRFHGVCFSLLTRTPFVALPSNSWKIEALLGDAGISDRRVVRPDQLARCVTEPDAWAFTPQERLALERFLGEAAARARAMFDEIAVLTNLRQ